jgi:hypothetical protein
MAHPETPVRPSATPASDRYGRRDPAAGRRRAIAGGAVVALALFAWAVWMGVRQPEAGLRWRAGTFSAVDDGRAALDLTVSLDPGRTAVCTVRMFNSGLTVVGRKDVTIGPSAERTIQISAVVPTFERATSGAVRACAAR